MNVIQIFVNEEDGERLDYYLATNLNEISRTYIQKLIKDKLVLVNEEYEKPKYIVQEGDHIKINMPKPIKLDVIAEDIPLDIIYEDEDVVIVNKDQNMVVHPAPGNYNGTMVNALIFQIKNLSSINGVIRPGIIHRLDKDTSGLIMVAKNDESHRFLSEQLKNRSVKREYIALVHGALSNIESTINAPIGRDPRDRKKMTVIKTNSKEAITHYKVIEEFQKYSLVKANLETGRTHQIRVHFAYINHPIVGDKIYSKRSNPFSVEKQLLHAIKIGFIHPSTKEYMEFETEIPERFKNVINIIKAED